jgi:hypothetical protein
VNVVVLLIKILDWLLIQLAELLCLVGTLAQLSWNAAECHRKQRSATKSIIVICTIAYMYIVFVQDIIT